VTVDGFRIATFNVENLGSEAGHGSTLEERVQVLRPQLQRLRADILCLQEVDSQRRPGAAGRGFDALDRVLERTDYAGFHRLASRRRSRADPRDKHNLVLLSRWPFAAQRQVFHDLVAPPTYQPACCRPAAKPDAAIRLDWDRPLLHAAIELAPGRCLHVINLHLRAPRAAFLPGQKADAATWRSMAAWAEGFFMAAVKRDGQALEARLLIDQLFDADAAALVVVCGDFNADVFEVPVRTIRGDEEDAGNPHLVMRALVPVERTLPDQRRYSVVHHGRPQMLDHILVSKPLLAWYRAIEVHNEALGDELMTPRAVAGALASFHAPVVAEFRCPDGACRTG
jgi:endonuclease/exonuclease/phosphatase family metal-dependent hydrolase